jgi:hypothetical protein
MKYNPQEFIVSLNINPIKIYDNPLFLKPEIYKKNNLIKSILYIKINSLT